MSLMKSFMFRWLHSSSNDFKGDALVEDELAVLGEMLNGHSAFIAVWAGDVE